jgi:vacuolar-type H+-ATPase subunit E/Vma4
VSLEHLLHALERQAAETASAELEAARAEAARIEAEAAERLATRTTTGLEEQAVVLRASAERAIAEARRSQRRRVLEAREEILERIFARALQIVANGDSAAPDLLAVEVRHALDYVGSVPAVVHCAPTVVERLRAILAERDGLTVQPDPALRDGFRVRAADGSVLVDHTPERRLAALRPVLAIELLRRIEPPS